MNQEEDTILQSGFPLTLPTACIEHMLSNLLLIIGVARSGLTFFTALAATMKNVYRLNHPALFKLIPPHFPDDAINAIAPIIRLSLLYDHCVPMVRGIYLCEDPRHLLYRDWAWATCAERLIERRVSGESNNNAALQRITEERPLFISDLVDGFPHRRVIRRVFPSVRFLHIIRNGFDVIADYRKLKFASNEGIHYPVLPLLNWFNSELCCPWYVTEEAHEHWREWTETTKCAHLWRIQMGILGNDPCLKYEDIIKDPRIIPRTLANSFPFLSFTELTGMMQEKVKRECNDAMKTNESITLNNIEEPERSKFKEMMEMHGYL